MMKPSSESLNVIASVRGRSARSFEQLLMRASVMAAAITAKVTVMALRSRVLRLIGLRWCRGSSVMEPERAILAMPIGRSIACHGSRNREVSSGQP